MGRRKRKKVSFRLVRTVPKIFTCPACGHKTIKVTLRKQKENKALVICGHCGQQQEVPKTDISEAVDAFGEFIDIYFKDQEYERLTRRAQTLKEKGEFTELANVYAFLSDNASVNAEKALEGYEKNKDPKDLENAEKWKLMADEYKKEEKNERHRWQALLASVITATLIIGPILFLLLR